MLNMDKDSVSYKISKCKLITSTSQSLNCWKPKMLNIWGKGFYASFVQGIFLQVFLKELTLLIHPVLPVLHPYNNVTRLHVKVCKTWQLWSELEVNLISLRFLSFVFYLDFEIFPGIKHLWYCSCLKIVYKVTLLVFL